MKILEAWNWIKGLIALVWAWLLSFLYPLSGEISGLILLFVFNFIAGLIADILINDSKFQFSKAWKCISEATMFVLLIAGIFAIGKLKNVEESSLKGVSFVTYAVIYFYGINILRNLRSLFKEESAAYKVLNFIHYALSAEFIKIIPYLSEHINKSKNANQ